MAKEARDRYSNARAKAVIRINNEVNDIKKEMERDRDESGSAGADLMSTEVEGRRLASEIDRVREWSKGDKTDRRASADRDGDTAGRERAEAERLRDSLEEAEGQRDWFIGKLEELRGRLEALEGKLRWLDRQRKMRRGGPKILRNGTDWQRNQDRT